MPLPSCSLDCFVATILASLPREMPTHTRPQRIALERVFWLHPEWFQGETVRTGVRHMNCCRSTPTNDNADCDCPAALVLQMEYGDIEIDVTGNVDRSFVIPDDN